MCNVVLQNLNFSQKRLQIVQNKVIRFVLGIPPRTHLGCSECSIVNILPVKYRADQIKLNHMFNIVHGSAPEYLNRILTYQEATAMIPDQEIYIVSCQVSKVLVSSLFSTQLLNCGTLPTCNILVTNICSKRMLKHMYGRNYKLLIRMIIFISDHSQQLNCIPLFFYCFLSFF